MTEPLTAPVFHISRASLHDGDGIHTVVYLKGCPLHCLWCHNPEGLSAAPQILFRPARCIGCGRCLALCGCHSLQDGQHIYDRAACTACGRCADACPNEALTLCGGLQTADGVFRQVQKDAAYFAATGGGITLSGGECLLYPAFCAALLEKCRAAGIRTCAESCFAVPWENIAAVLGLLDLLYVDLKHPDAEAHRQLTGQDNTRILENLTRAAALHNNIRVRIPLIPGVNDADDTLCRAAALLGKIGGGLRAVEPLKYNPLASSKYASLGREARLFGQPQTDETLEHKRAVLRAALPEGIAVL